MIDLASRLPPGFAAAVFVVLHIGAQKSRLPWLLNQHGPLRACHPVDGDTIRPGHIYIAPPDHHMLIEPGHIRLTRGPRENWARPAIDPLFRSAAHTYGAAVIGVILTGGLNDGTAGLYEVQQCGGTTVVQDPADAASPSMPRSALEHVEVDHCLPLDRIPALLTSLAAGHEVQEDVEPTEQPMTAQYKHDRPIAVTCPDCGGALRDVKLGTLTQFVCHIGHIYTADIMVAAQFASMEWALSAALRALSERSEMCRQMEVKAGDPAIAAGWRDAAKEAATRMGAMREVLDQGWTHPGDADMPTPSGG